MKTHPNPNQIECTYFVFNLAEVPAFEPGRITSLLVFMMPSITSSKKENFNDIQLGTCWNGNLIEIKTAKNSLHIQKYSYIERNGAQNLFMWSASKILEQLKIKFNWEKKPFFITFMIPGKRFSWLFHLGNSLKFSASRLILTKTQLPWTKPIESTKEEKIVPMAMKWNHLTWFGKINSFCHRQIDTKEHKNSQSRVNPSSQDSSGISNTLFF